MNMAMGLTNAENSVILDSLKETAMAKADAQLNIAYQASALAPKPSWFPLARTHVGGAKALFFVPGVAMRRSPAMIRETPVLFFEIYEEWHAIPRYNGVRIPTEEEWTCLRDKVDKFYQHTKLEEIESLNAKRRNAFYQKARSGWVYVLQRGEDEFKIGFSKDPWKRMKALMENTTVSMVPYACIPDDDAFSLEKELHQKYADKRLHGEWFKLSSDDLDCLFSEYCAVPEH